MCDYLPCLLAEQTSRQQEGCTAVPLLVAGAASQLAQRSVSLTFSFCLCSGFCFCFVFLLIYLCFYP
jgi:hypothetical protein